MLRNTIGYFKAAGGGAPTYRFLRLHCTKSTDATQMRFFSLYWIADGADYPQTIGYMTNTNAPSPLVASSSTEFSTVYAAWKAFDSSASTYFMDRGLVMPAWHQIDLGAGNEIAPTAVGITPRDEVRAPEDFTCEGSNTGDFTGEEDILLTVTGEVTANWTNGVRRDFTF